MANKIKTIPVLERILKKRYRSVGGKKVEIGNYWSVLQIYFAMKEAGISINTLCSVASLMEGRIDSKHRPTEKQINHSKMRDYLTLKTSPPQISHTVVTKNVAKGASDSLVKAIEKTLTKYNSYGPQLRDAIIADVNRQKGELLSTKINVLGGSDFAYVLKLSITIRQMMSAGLMDSLSDIPNSEHVDTIINKIIECQEDESKWNHMGESYSLRFMQI